MNEETKKLINEDYENGLSIGEICKKYNMSSKSYISNYILSGGTRSLSESVKMAHKKYSESLLAPIQVSFTLNRTEPREIYAQEEYAKAADRMLKFIGIDAAFTLGYIDGENVHISARGGKRVNVGTIMKAMSGQCGGNAQSAGGRIKTDDIEEIERELVEKVKLGVSEEVPVMEEPPIIKMKKRKSKK